MEKELERVSGMIEESELKVLIGDEEAVGAAPAWTWVIPIVHITLSAGACPTSACTRSCNR